MTLQVSEEDLKARTPAIHDLSTNEFGLGRELFSQFRSAVGPAERGATIFNWGDE